LIIISDSFDEGNEEKWKKKRTELLSISMNENPKKKTQKRNNIVKLVKNSVQKRTNKIWKPYYEEKIQIDKFWKGSDNQMRLIKRKSSVRVHLVFIEDL
jgi:hypothetical protein